MTIKSTNLTWVCVADLDKALKFYVQTLGFKQLFVSQEHGWAELEGEEGEGRIGLATKSSGGPISPGNNGVPTLNVDNIEAETAELKQKGAKMVGELQEVPGHVKMQLLVDPDGNHLQLVEQL